MIHEQRLVGFTRQADIASLFLSDPAGDGGYLRGYGAGRRIRVCHHVLARSLVIAPTMTDHPIELDEHRGMKAQQATELRRLVSEVAADRASLKARQEELEKFLIAAPSATWSEAVEKARYLLTLFAATQDAQDPRRKTLIAGLLGDFERLLGLSSGNPLSGNEPSIEDE
jgi:hypothetical protein